MDGRKEPVVEETNDELQKERHHQGILRMTVKLMNIRLRKSLEMETRPRNCLKKKKPTKCRQSTMKEELKPSPKKKSASTSEKWEVLEHNEMYSLFSASYPDYVVKDIEEFVRTAEQDAGSAIEATTWDELVEAEQVATVEAAKLRLVLESFFTKNQFWTILVVPCKKFMHDCNEHDKNLFAEMSLRNTFVDDPDSALSLENCAPMPLRPNLILAVRLQQKHEDLMKDCVVDGEYEEAPQLVANLWAEFLYLHVSKGAKFYSKMEEAVVANQVVLVVAALPV
eukprot:Gb_23291 [translate_table: standard]